MLYICLIALEIEKHYHYFFTSLSFDCFYYLKNIKTPVKVDIHQINEINKKYPTIFLIRHGERCDRSDNICLSDQKGITVEGAKKAQQYGEFFNKYFQQHSVYTTNTLRTIQTANFFSEAKKNIIPHSSTFDEALENIKKVSENNKITVIFTHNHCLSRIAKGMSGWKLKPQYLDTLVLHREGDRLILDGILIL
ncbi:lipopolysaccharide core heptose(II)-phosphate phosphatase [Escherichia coli]|uniref:lipopolysaccharide core heptose(II)-phosphate phosphatase n=1 Tax=Escherichia coli TaxID=562 RepID=UPI0010E962FD|nr:lipopolysaccharide core heptose(II)-phosphate phosphatase [Escherichia coli]GCV07077.1 lipopolysaccharide core heptose(II)-phosphate phosphatase [Escherichia coli]HDV7650508.1 lipopolysaccharide core heptose(II)-phosphate phosphatase [Escherichia coli]